MLIFDKNKKNTSTTTQCLWRLLQVEELANQLAHECARASGP